MKLSFSKPYKSIRNLPACDINNFTVLTGTNGAGKTHLLEAIEQKNITVEDLPRKEGAIRKFNWSTFIAKITEDANPDQLYKQREAAIANVLANQKARKLQLSNFFQQQKVNGDARTADPEWLATASLDQISEVLKTCTRNGMPLNELNAKSMGNFMCQHRENAEKQFVQQIAQYGDLPAVIQKTANEKGIYTMNVPEADFRKHFPLTWSPNNTLQLEFANWFSAWHAAWEYNKINRYYNTQEGSKEKLYLSDEDFFRLYGKEPWKIANAVLTAAGFRHQFNKPTGQIGNLEKPFQLRLQDPEDGTQIKTDELSSGEKILLAITLMLYQSSGELNIIRLPQLLLLDEIDAPLHPSFTKSLIDILLNKFVAELKVAVILTTHSPSTVALAPSESVYELVRKPRQIKQISKSSATQLLSAGYISVSPGDIIVLTESSADADYYQTVHETLALKGKMANGPPLKFIAVSSPNNPGLGGGCAQVQNWAPKLHGLGISRFRGLIDNDGKNKSDTIICVLTRYSIENYLFDPLSLSAYLIHRGIDEPFAGAARNFRTAQDFIQGNGVAIQPVLDAFCKWLSVELKTPEIATSFPIACNYIGMQSVHIPVWWIEKRGHDLESIIRAPLNSLGAKTGRGALLKEGKLDEIIKFQTQSFPELISSDLLSIFIRLAQI